jgi:polysaccharide export outer membrane protein
MLVLGGCSQSIRVKASADGGSAAAKQGEQGSDIGDVQIRDFLLSPGDELRIFVYKNEELTRTVKIPPSGSFYYPIVGVIDTTGKSLKDLREIITDGLSRHQKQTLLPGDKVFIQVFRNAEYNREFIIPSDGTIFFPYVGYIDIEGKTLKDLGTIITNGLSDQVIDPQVIVDIVELNNPVRIPNPQVSIEVSSFSGQKVFVLGEVNRPGVFLADGATSLVEAVTLAGGPTLDAKISNVVLVRRGVNPEKPEIIVADLRKIIGEGDFAENPILRRGDIVYVPRTFIANVDRFFQHLSVIVNPLLDIETGYWVGQNIEAGPSGENIVIFP